MKELITAAEVILSLVVIGLQILFFAKSYFKIKKLRFVFPSQQESGEAPYKVDVFMIDKNTHQIVEDDEDSFDYDASDYLEVDLLTVSTKSTISESFRKIVSATNKYLKNNKGFASDFNILRDIAERTSQSEEQDISVGISVPLYMGLMGTFLGVFLGIVSITLSGEGVSDGSIKSFLFGVSIAMIGSFVGLLLTTLNNSMFFNKAISDRDSAKNDYYNFLQAELMPVVSRDMASSLGDLKGNLDAFNAEFSTNIKEFKGTIPSITKNLEMQTAFIAQIDKMDMAQIVSANKTLFESFVGNIHKLEPLSTYADSLTNSIHNSILAAKAMNELLNRFKQFEDSLNNLGPNIGEITNSYQDIALFLKSSLTTIRDRNEVVKQQVDITDKELVNFLDAEKDNMTKITQDLQKRFDGIFEVQGDKKFFDNLHYLKSINESLEKLNININNMKRGSGGIGETTGMEPVLKDLTAQLKKMNSKIHPPLYRPIQLFRYISSSNGRA